MTDLKQKSCKPCHGGVKAINHSEAEELLKQIPGWSLNSKAVEISRTYNFKNYYETMAFVNAAAWIAHSEDHHPAMEIGYKHCQVRYSTHAIGGLSENDFICAAKVNALVGQ